MTRYKARCMGVVAAAVAAALLCACGGKREEDKEITARIVAQLEAQKTPEQREADAKRAAEEAAIQSRRIALLARMVAEVRVLREAMKNPKSFDLASITHIEKTGINCIVYRGTNSFNAVVPAFVAIGPDGKSRAWDSACANKSGIDWTDQVKLVL